MGIMDAVESLLRSTHQAGNPGNAITLLHPLFLFYYEDVKINAYFVSNPRPKIFGWWTKGAVKGNEKNRIVEFFRDLVISLGILFACKSGKNLLC